MWPKERSSNSGKKNNHIMCIPYSVSIGELANEGWMDRTRFMDGEIRNI
jgi:hypothetical protein